MNFWELFRRTCQIAESSSPEKDHGESLDSSRSLNRWVWRTCNLIGQGPSGPDGWQEALQEIPATGRPSRAVLIIVFLLYFIFEHRLKKVPPGTGNNCLKSMLEWHLHSENGQKQFHLAKVINKKSSMLEKCDFIDNSKGLKVAALSMSFRTWPN